MSDRFAELGVPVVDTDRIAREVVEPGEPTLQQVAEAFGQDVLGADGSLDRKLLREIIFSDAERRRTLDSIMHPAIAERARARVREIRAPYCIMVVPLYTETGLFSWADRVLLVDVDEATQVRRLMHRDGVTRQQAEAALAAQASRRERQELADDIIENSGTVEDLRASVDRLHRRYLAA